MEVFCDFDGTITEFDVLDHIIEVFYGKDKQLLFQQELLDGKIEHNKQLSEIFTRMGYSITDIISLLSKKYPNGIIEKSFPDFYKLCISKGIKFYIISGGFTQIIEHYLPIHSTHIYANDFNNLSNLQDLDKVKIVNSLKSSNAKCIYIGDGASDMHMVGNCDILFVKKNSVLENYCIKNNHEYKPFTNFTEISEHLFSKLLDQNVHHQKYKLLSPGVVRVPKNVLNALAHQHTFMHRHSQFHELYDQIDKKLGLLVCSEIDKYITLLVTGSGTSSMDEVINTHVHKDKTLFLSNGMFGERWISIAEFYCPSNVYKIVNKWGEPFNMNTIKESIINNGIRHVVVVHCDTSVGILNDIHKIGELIYEINKIRSDTLDQTLGSITYIVDAVSTFGGIPIDMEKSHINFLVTNPNKALASHMGIGIIIGKHENFNLLKVSDSSSYSLNLKKHYEHALHRETCNTVSISSMMALLESLNSSFQNAYSIENNYSNYKNLFNLCYKKIKYPKLLDESISSPSIITILVNGSDKIINYLYKHGFIVYECKGDLLNKGFQISFYGVDGTEENILHLIDLINTF